MTFISYAQNGEDVILWRALQHVENGFYIDVGACDPTELSVTRAFYERGWTGINIEPSKEFFDRCVAERPRDMNLNVAVTAQAGIIRFLHVPGTGLSTTLDDVAANATGRGWSVEERTVPALSLADICRSAKTSEVHFLKIDVEGGERSVLEGADFQAFRPWVVLVEATMPLSTERNDHLWQDLLLNAGYDQVFFDGVNLYFVAAEHRELIEKLAIPPNALDDFKPVLQQQTEVLSAERAALLEQTTSQLAAERQMSAALQAKLQPVEERIVELSTNLAERDVALEHTTMRLTAEEQMSSALRSKLELAEGQLAELTALLSQRDEALQSMTLSQGKLEQALNTAQHEVKVTQDGLATTRGKLERVQRALAEADRKLADQGRQLRDRTTQLRRRTDMLEQVQTALRQYQSDSDIWDGDIVSVLRNLLAEQSYQLNVLRNQQAAVQHHRDSLLLSTSWRLTKPLRKTSAAVRVLRHQPTQFLPLLWKNVRGQHNLPMLPMLTPKLVPATSAVSPLQLPVDYEMLSHRDKLVTMLQADIARQRQLISST